MANLVTNADDVEVIIEPANPDQIGVPAQLRVVGEEFTISTEQDIASVSGFSQNSPKGLTKGDIEHTFDFSIEGENEDVMVAMSDESGDSRPFAMTARKIPDEGSDAEWEYSYMLCLAEAEEISGTTGETIGLSIEGYGAGRNRDI